MRRNLPFLIFSALVLIVLIALGTWQVQRLGEKRAYLDEIEATIGAAPGPLPASVDPEMHRFLSVALTGRLVGPEVHVLISTRDFGAGYRVIQAFDTGGRRVLVDRGYIRLTDKDRPRTGDPIKITGNLYWPDEIDSYTPENDLGKNIWYARDVPALARALETEPIMLIVRTSSDQDGHVTPLPVDTSSIPNRHLEYLLTWYGLALTWVLMTLYFLRRGRAPIKGES